jgi:hypothetical protein
MINVWYFRSRTEEPEEVEIEKMVGTKRGGRER